jgi:hypothetical protein
MSENDDGVQTREDDEHGPTSITSSVSPPKNGLMHSASAGHSPAGNLQGGPFMGGDLPVRGSQYAAHMIPSDIGHEHHHFVDGVSMVGGQTLHHNGSLPMQVGGEIIPNPHDASRRPSLFNSPTDYSSPTAPSMYNQPWQPGSAAPSISSMYAFTPQQATPAQAPFVGQASVPLPPNQPNLRSDGLPPPGGYDHLMQSGNPFRAGNVTQPSVPQAQGYPHYLQHDTRTVPGSGVKVESLTRGPLH